jgi:hypothetical protein
MDLLRSLPADTKSPYFFPAERGGKFYVGTKRIWPEAIKLAELPGVTPHHFVTLWALQPFHPANH